MEVLKFYSIIGFSWLLVWLYRLKFREDINISIFNTGEHITWIYLHIITYVSAGYLINIDQQIIVFIIYLLFEIFEYIGKRNSINFLNNTLDLENYKILIHDIIMNLSAQIIGLALSERLQIIIKRII